MFTSRSLSAHCQKSYLILLSHFCRYTLHWCPPPKTPTFLLIPPENYLRDIGFLNSYLCFKVMISSPPARSLPKLFYFIQDSALVDISKLHCFTPFEHRLAFLHLVISRNKVDFPALFGPIILMMSHEES